MNEILCKECGDEINRHDTPGCINCHCLLTPNDIAAHAVEQARKEAKYDAFSDALVFIQGSKTNTEAFQKVLNFRDDPAAPESQT